MSAPPTPAARVLQPAAWRRAIAPIVVAVLVLSVVLQEPVAALLPSATPRVIVFAAIAVPVVVALALGLGAAYPKVVMTPDGALRVRGRHIRPSEIVRVRRAVSSGGGAAYLVLTLGTTSGRGVRVLVAGTPIRGLDAEQLGMLREVVVASAIPAARDSESERAFLSESVLASGRRVEADRGLVLRELDELRGVAYRPESEQTHPTPTDEVPDADGARAVMADDRAAAERLAESTGPSRLARRIALWVFVLICAAAAVLLVVLVVMESAGTDFGAADEDPLTAAMSVAMLLALLTGIGWAVAADVDDARIRAVSQGWLAEASDAQRARGLPTPFHAAWLRAPGGRMAGFGLLVLAVVALLTLIGGPVALAQGFGPPAVGVVVTIVGVVLAVLAWWLWSARRRAHARRVEWLIGAAGERATGPDLGDPSTR